MGAEMIGKFVTCARPNGASSAMALYLVETANPHANPASTYALSERVSSAFKISAIRDAHEERDWHVDRAKVRISDVVVTRRSRTTRTASRSCDLRHAFQSSTAE